jgi:hypothetical protein
MATAFPRTMSMAASAADQCQFITN